MREKHNTYQKLLKKSEFEYRKKMSKSAVKLKTNSNFWMLQKTTAKTPTKWGARKKKNISTHIHKYITTHVCMYK